MGNMSLSNKFSKQAYKMAILDGEHRKLSDSMSVNVPLKLQGKKI